MSPVVTMTPRQVAATVACCRCGQTPPYRPAAPFLSVSDRGVLIGLVCWACQTTPERDTAVWWERLRRDFGKAAGFKTPPRVTVQRTLVPSV